MTDFRVSKTRITTLRGMLNSFSTTDNSLRRGGVHITSPMELKRWGDVTRAAARDEAENLYNKDRIRAAARSMTTRANRDAGYLAGVAEDEPTRAAEAVKRYVDQGDGVCVFPGEHVAVYDPDTADMRCVSAHNVRVHVGGELLTRSTDPDVPRRMIERVRRVVTSRDTIRLYSPAKVWGVTWDELNTVDHPRMRRLTAMWEPYDGVSLSYVASYSENESVAALAAGSYVMQHCNTDDFGGLAINYAESNTAFLLRRCDGIGYSRSIALAYGLVHSVPRVMSSEADRAQREMLDRVMSLPAEYGPGPWMTDRMRGYTATELISATNAVQRHGRTLDEDIPVHDAARLAWMGLVGSTLHYGSLIRAYSAADSVTQLFGDVDGGVDHDTLVSAMNGDDLDMLRNIPRFRCRWEGENMTVMQRFLARYDTRKFY